MDKTWLEKRKMEVQKRTSPIYQSRVARLPARRNYAKDLLRELSVCRVSLSAVSTYMHNVNQAADSESGSAEKG